MNFIYFHGFNSSGRKTSEKIKALEKIGEVEFINYDSFADYYSIKEQLKEAVINRIKSNIDNDYILCGTSLGGFWAATISKETGLPAILINPAINPLESLKKYLNLELENYVTGEVNTLKEENISDYPQIPKVGRFIILLDTGDEVFDSVQTYKYFKNNTKHVFKDGSHRFDHMKESLPLIKRWFNHLQTSI